MAEEARLTVEVTHWQTSNFFTVMIFEETADEEEDDDDDDCITAENNIICDDDGIQYAIDPGDGSTCPICGEPYDSGIPFADVRWIELITDTDALDTLRRLDLLDKHLEFDSWDIWPPLKVIDYLHGKGNGIKTVGNMITFGDEEIPQEGMEVLCQLGLLDRPLKGWREERRRPQLHIVKPEET